MSTSPPSLANQFSEASNPTLQARVEMSYCKTAQNVGSEDPAAPNHANRVQLATQVARSPQMFREPFTFMLCGQGITNQSADTDIDNMVSSVWNTMAGQPITV